MTRRAAAPHDQIEAVASLPPNLDFGYHVFQVPKLTFLAAARRAAPRLSIAETGEDWRFDGYTSDAVFLRLLLPGSVWWPQVEVRIDAHFEEAQTTLWVSTSPHTTHVLILLARFVHEVEAELAS